MLWEEGILGRSEEMAVMACSHDNEEEGQPQV